MFQIINNKMRKFGVEIELNSFDQRDFKVDPLFGREMPDGIEYICNLIKSTGQPARIENWHHTHDNQDWVCKPDSSCGIELCSPVLGSIDNLIKIIEILSVDPKIKIDNRCSFHVHFSIKDCLSNKVMDSEKLAAILAWWIKCESIFFDSMPDSRKTNRYCQFIGISELFEFEDVVRPNLIIEKLGANKYYSSNVYHLLKNNRPTIEFRIADYSACLDSNFASNWIFLLDRFIDRAVCHGLPKNFSWINPKEFFEFLDLNNEIKTWFLNRLITNIKSEHHYFDFNMRKMAILEIENLLQLDKDPGVYLNSMDK